MKKTLTVFLFALFLLSVPVFSEARTGSETQTPVSLNGSAPEFNQTSGVGRVYTRRRVRRRRMRRHMMRRRMRVHYRGVHPRRRLYVIRRR